MLVPRYRSQNRLSWKAPGRIQSPTAAGRFWKALHSFGSCHSSCYCSWRLCFQPGPCALALKLTKPHPVVPFLQPTPTIPVRPGFDPEPGTWGGGVGVPGPVLAAEEKAKQRIMQSFQILEVLAWRSILGSGINHSWVRLAGRTRLGSYWLEISFAGMT